MKNRLLLVIACFSFALFSCEKKADTIPNETSNKVDDALKATNLSAEAKSAAKEITAENVDKEADALLKEIENDEF